MYSARIRAIVVGIKATLNEKVYWIKLSRFGVVKLDMLFWHSNKK